MTIKFESSVLFVNDVAKSREFYEKLFGQKVTMDFGANVAFEGGFSIWQADMAQEIIFGKASEAQLGSKQNNNNFELYFETEDIEAALQRIQDSGIGLVHSLVEAPWGQRTFRMYDPDSHIVEIGEPMPVVVKRYLDEGLTPEDIVQKTYMPIDNVRKIAES